MNKIQEKSKQLMCNDLRILYTTMKNGEYTKPNYYIALMPYMGIVIDGVEDWVNAYNNSMKDKLDIPVFNDEEKVYYEMMRNSTKIFKDGYKDAYDMLKEKYEESINHFSSVCKPIAKILHLYDIFGIYTMNGEYCGNTILGSYYLPFHRYDKDFGEKIRKLSKIGGAYIWHFNATQEYSVKPNCVFDDKDFGGFIKSPVGNRYGIKFLLLCIYCQINFIIHCIDEFIVEETSSKLRFAYILYYYLLNAIPKINEDIKSNFSIDNKYYNELFRNSMMHYKLGVALKENELVEDDHMYGLTQKFFHTDYLTLKNGVINELKNLKFQLKEFLDL